MPPRAEQLDERPSTGGRLLLVGILVAAMAVGCDRREMPPETQQQIPTEFAAIIARESTPVEYRQTLPYHGGERAPLPEFITNIEAMEDIEMAEYLLATSYSGYDYWQHRGVDFESYFRDLRQFVKGKERMATYDFERQLSTILRHINDGHIAFIGHGYNMGYRHKAVYYAGIVVERTASGAYRVLSSQAESVDTGDLFTQTGTDAYLFRTLSPPGTDHYLVGAQSFEPVTEAELSFNNRPTRVPFYKSRLLLARFDDARPFYVERIGGTSVVRVTGFANEIYAEMKDFMAAGSTLRNEPTIVVNLLNNGGGSSVFPQGFIRNLNGSIRWESRWAELTTPAIVEYYAKYDLAAGPEMSPEYRSLIDSYAKQYERYRTAPAKTWRFASTSDEGQGPGEYEGRLVVITNRRVLSAGEGMVGVSRSVPNSIAIGENTGGVARFSSGCGYYLPYSKIVLHLPRQLILIPGLEEGVGYAPDYWLDTAEPVAHVLSWLDDPDNYRFEYESSYGELIESLAASAVLPEGLTFRDPAPDVPEWMARFSGKWLGHADGVLEHLLAVHSIEAPDQVDAIYAWGVAPQWGIEQPGYQRFKGRFEGDRLVLEEPERRLRITYWVEPDGTMRSVYERPGIYSRTHLVQLDH